MSKKLIVLVICLCLSMFACANPQKDILKTTESQVKLRSIQTRVFDTTDRNHMLRTIIATMQDLGFVIDKADDELGAVSGTKRSGYALRMTVSIRPKGDSQMLVRSNVQYNLQLVEDPEPYQQFFAALYKALFLEAQQNEYENKDYQQHSRSQGNNLGPDMPMYVKTNQPFEMLLAQAQCGIVEAQERVAVSYHHGAGVEKDLVKAATWYITAADHSSEYAASELLKLKMLLTSDEYLEAETAARTWQPDSAACRDTSEGTEKKGI